LHAGLLNITCITSYGSIVYNIFVLPFFYFPPETRRHHPDNGFEDVEEGEGSESEEELSKRARKRRRQKRKKSSEGYCEESKKVGLR
jgi:hypothetical protein